MKAPDGRDAALMSLVQAIVRGDAEIASRLLAASPDLAAASFNPGTIAAQGLTSEVRQLNGVPSVVMGLFVYLIWTLSFGYSAFGGALALACLMLPVVIGATEQMLKSALEGFSHQFKPAG